MILKNNELIVDNFAGGGTSGQEFEVSGGQTEMKKCDKFGCVANLNGECVNDECRGELIQRPPCRISDKEKRKEWYNIHADTFRRDFPETDIKAQMRQDGLCEEDIELAVSAIYELKKGGRENG